MSVHHCLLPRPRLGAKREYGCSQREFIPSWLGQGLAGPMLSDTATSAYWPTQQRRVEQSFDPRNTSQCLKGPSHDLEEAECLDDSAWRMGDKPGCELVPSVLGTGHDPFHSSPGRLEPRQLSLVHTCKSSFDLVNLPLLADIVHQDLTYLAPSTFGIPRETAYVPANRITSLCFQYSESGTLWTAILAEEMICRLSGQARSRDMVLQKTIGTTLFAKTLREYRKNFPAAWLALIKAAQLSLWFGDTKTQSVHWTTAALLVKSVGGLKNALVLAADIEPNYIASPFYWVRSLIPHRRSLEGAMVRCFRWLNILLRGDRIRWLEDDVSPVLEHNRNKVQLGRAGLEVEAEVLQYFKPFIAPKISSPLAPHRFQLMTCMELCWNYHTFSSDASLLYQVLQRIRDLFSQIPEPQTEQELDRRLAAYSAILGHVRQEVFAAVGSSKSAWTTESNMRITQLEIDGASVFDHIGPESRYTILMKLYIWLMGQQDGEMPFSATEIRMYTHEALVVWAATATTGT
jgi:hypothetical protein